MKPRIYTVPLLVLFSFFFLFLLDNSTTTVKKQQLSIEQIEVLPGGDKEKEESAMDKLIAEEIEKMKDPATGEVPIERILVAKQFQEAKFAVQKASRVNSPVPGINWIERGPNNVAGRTRTILYDANVPSGIKVWTGGVGGGLWWCNDITAATPVWNKFNDLLDNLAVTTIAQDPTTPMTMYFGTGEGWFNGDAIRGLGIWKSTNGGTTWTQLASTNNSTFHFLQKIVVTSTGTVLAATAAGVMRSIDGGTNWSNVLGSAASDLEVAADGKIYACTGIFTLGGIHRSIDDGASYTSIYTNAGDEFRIEIGCAGSNADVIYAILQDGNGPDNIPNNDDDDGLKQIMKTTNATAVTPTWTTLTVPPWCDNGNASMDFTRQQAWYDLMVEVEPTNENIVYIGGVDVHKTINGGTTWDQISQWLGNCAEQFIHADIHDLAFKPGTPSELLIATDGGIFRSTDAGAIFINRNTSFNVTQFYSCAIHPTNPNYFLAGSQDNGSQKFTLPGLSNTTQASGGDGGFCHIDQDNPNTQITSFVQNNYAVSIDGGTSFVQYGFGGGTFINPTDYDNAVDILYGGFAGGQFFRWHSPGYGGPAFSVQVNSFAGSGVRHVAVSPSVLNRVYFGLANGAVVRVNNANVSNADTARIKLAGGGSVSCIAVDPSNENHMLVTYSNYGVASIFESFNANSGAATWTNVEGDLPDMPVRWVLFDPRSPDWAIIATELGVWSTDDINGASTDWEPTNTNFASTRVDMLKYRSSDRTLAAGTHGRGLYTTTIPLGTTPAINFEKAVAGVTEQTLTTSGCRYFRDYTLNMTIENAPVGDATVTLSIRAGNTAQPLLDFDFTTNGNFAAPSNTLVFNNGSAAPKTITIRVYDDAEVENEESFTLEYAISGATNAIAGNGAQTYSLLIRSIDLTPMANNVAIGAFSSTIGASGPLRSNEQKHRIQALYRASELQAVGLGKGDISSLVLMVTQKLSTRPYNGFTISLAHTSATDLSTGFIAPAFTQVYTADYNSVVGDNTFVFPTGGGSLPFTWDGTSNLVIQFCFDNGTVSPADVNNDQMEGTNIPFGPGVIASTYSNHATGNATPGCSLPASIITAFRINLRLNVVRSVATALSSSRMEYFGPNADLYFYEPTGSILARVRNLSAHDYGCTQVVIDRAGTGSSQFWNNNTANYLMNKTLRILPTTNNVSGNFDVTFYYTQAEVDGWQTATGQTFSNIQLVKVQGQISDVTPGNPSGGGTVQLVTPTNTAYGIHSSLTHTFNNGFSGFGAGIAGTALPVELLDFTGRLRNNSVELNWKTSFELNSKGFDIERSYDGQVFERIGYVSAAGNSSLILNYQFTDRSISQENNYYRLKQIDLDEKFEYSRVVLIKNPLIDKNPFKVMKNPFNSTIDIQFAKVPDGNVQIRLFDGAGKSVVNWNVKNVSFNRLRLDVGDRHLSAGVYILKVNTTNKEYVERILKE